VSPSNCSLTCPCGACYATHGGLVGCFACAAGSVASADYRRCEQCAAGTYVQLGQCSPCGLGFASTPSRTTCVLCASGEATADRSACVPCAADTYAESPPATGCAPCRVLSIKQFLRGTCSLASTNGAILLGALAALLVVLLGVALVAVHLHRKARAAKQLAGYQKLLDNNGDPSEYFDDPTPTPETK
jgi:hypothetical protein